MRTFFLLCGIVICGVSNPAVASDYKVGIGDVLTITVLGESEFSGVFKVSTDGTIDYPYLRKIEVKDKTIEELGTLVTDKLKEGYFKDPQVTVAIKEYLSQQILIVGGVPKPGKYVLTGQTRIIDALSMAGGIGNQSGKKIILLRGGKISNDSDAAAALKTVERVDPMIIDYYSLVHQGDFSQNLVMKDGDIINVPEANQIFVFGNVAKPGPVKYEEKMTILQAVNLAGGPTPTASTKSTYILRQSTEGQKKIPIRLDKILENKERNAIALLADDVIVVPESFF